MKKTIAVIFGGKSAEHEVSIITGHVPIIESLKATGQYEIVPIYIAKDGSWYSESEMNDLAYFKDQNLEEKIKKLKKIQLSFDNGLTIIWPGNIAGLRTKMTKIDIVFPAMHGTYGEDGSLQGLLRLANVPFVGCDLFASATAMDKVLTKQIIAHEGVPVVPYVWFVKKDWEENKKAWQEKINKLKWPLFIKPVHLGSSIAITKAKTEVELENAIEVAFHYDDKVLVEESIEDLTEVTLPIMGNNEPRLGGIEKALNKSEFFDFSEKYLAGGKKSNGANSQYSEIPAKIDPKLTETVEKYGKETYRILGCTGIARVDFLIDNAKSRVYVNEVNTLPGSLYHHNWRKMGVSSVDLVQKLVALAEDKFNETKDITHTFNSDILKNAGGAKIND